MRDGVSRADRAAYLSQNSLGCFMAARWHVSLCLKDVLSSALGYFSSSELISLVDVLSADWFILRLFRLLDGHVVVACEVGLTP